MISRGVERNIYFNIAYGYIKSSKSISRRLKRENLLINCLKFLSYIPIISMVAAFVLFRVLQYRIFYEARIHNPIYQAYKSRLIIQCIPGINLLLMPIDLITHVFVRPVLQLQLKKLGRPLFPQILYQIRRSSYD